MKSWNPVRILSAAALVCASGLLGVSAGTAGAAPAEGKSLVVIGDSYTTNGDIFYSMGFGAGIDNSCQRSPTRWPAQLAAQAGLPEDDMVDVSCLGASLVTPPHFTLSHMAKLADAAGGFGPRTKAVVIQLGQNDIWNTSNKQTMLNAIMTCLPDLLRGCGADAALDGRGPDYRGVDADQFARWVKPVTDYIRYYAPQAKIVLAGYPEFAPRGEQVLCLDTTAGRLTQTRAAALTEFMDRVDDAQRAAAQTLGLDFFDVRAITAGHGSCAADSWLNGFFPLEGELRGIFLHPTVHADSVVASTFRQQFGL